MRRLTHEQGLSVMLDHYNSQINSICDRIEFHQSIGIVRTEKDVSDTNEKLYGLFMSRKNILGILDRMDEEFFDE